MESIIIRNFGAIKEANISVKKVLVLIGEQASGKSTIAKLIYFFKSLRDDIFAKIYSDNDKDFFDITSDTIFPIKEKFYDFFGSTYHLPEFEIIYYYNNDPRNEKYIILRLDEKRKLFAKFKGNFITQEFRNSIGQVKKMLQQERINENSRKQLVSEQNKIKLAQRLSTLISDFFETKQTDALFVIAGRNATVSYSDFFEKYLFANVKNIVELNSKKKFQKKQQTIEETLMLKFMERVIRIKEMFKKFNNFDGLIETYVDKKSNRDELYLVRDKIYEILKGRYSIDNYGEKIFVNSSKNEFVYLSNASSGQQESIRILQDIFLDILENSKTLKIIEEPETHLFPTAQKKIIELLSYLINQNSENQIVITTHSPYVLTVFNNLLFANRVVEKNSKTLNVVEKIIPERFWLNPKEFAAYSLTNRTIDEKDSTNCSSIFDEETGMIDQNFLDQVSEQLGNDFNSLYEIHSKAYNRDE